MSEYTPTTEEVREAYAKRRALYLASSGHVLSNDAKYDREDYAEFDRWLAAHDAEVRAATLREALDAEAHPFELLDFREAWEEADARREVGTRLRQGLAAMLKQRAALIAERLGVVAVAEEPEWEYGWRSRFATGGPVFQELEWGSREQAEQSIRDHEQWEADDPEESRLVYELVQRTPAVRAGEWVPVKQEGANDV